jgi:hypothetical protein
MAHVNAEETDKGIPDKKIGDPKSIAKRLLKSMSELQYIDRPKSQNAGICHLCMCLDDQRRPTHDSYAVGNTMYWCKRCGLYLGLRDMDAYYQSETYAIEKAFRQQKAGGT